MLISYFQKSNDDLSKEKGGYVSLKNSLKLKTPKTLNLSDVILKEG